MGARVRRARLRMAGKKKKASIVLRLVSQAGTGYFYTIRKAIRANAEKCAARCKYPLLFLLPISPVAPDG